MELNVEHIGDQKMGMLVYRNVLNKDLRLIERIESLIGQRTEPPFCWSDARVGDNQKMPEYRDCVDFKISEGHLAYIPQGLEEVRGVYEDTVSRLRQCVAHYQSIYNINMEFMEAVNYVRYGPGQHFAVHSDHGFSYNCTLSSVMYLNDDYEGGELWFPYLDVKAKPKIGDIFLFPSTYIYAHASLPVLSGVKYAAVTMFDWNDRTHKSGVAYQA